MPPPGLGIVSVERHRALVALGRSLRVAAACVVVAEEAEGDAIVGVQLGRGEKMLRALHAQNQPTNQRRTKKRS